MPPHPRRAQEEPEPELDVEPEEDLFEERPVSEDSVSTNALVYGNEIRPDDEGYLMPRYAYLSPSREEVALLCYINTASTSQNGGSTVLP